MSNPQKNSVAENLLFVESPDLETTHLNLCLQNILKSEDSEHKLKYLALAEKYAFLENNRRKQSITTDLISYKFGCVLTEEEQSNLINLKMKQYLETTDENYFFFAMCLELILGAQKQPNNPLSELLKYLEDWINLSYRD